MNAKARLETVKNVIKQIYIKPENERIYSYAAVKILLTELQEIAEEEKLANAFIEEEVQLILNSCGILCGIEKDADGNPDEEHLQIAYKAIKAMQSDEGFKVA